MKKTILRKTRSTPNKDWTFFSSSSFVRIFRLHIVLLIMVLLSSCATNKDTIAAGLPDPDTGFVTGTATGYTVYIWECYQGRRIVIFNGTAEFTSSDYERQEASCGETTPIEEKLKDDPKREVDPNLFWQ